MDNLIIKHQENLAAALKFFIDSDPDAINGIVIIVGKNNSNLQGKLVFEIKGKLPFEEAYMEKMEKIRNETLAI